jgi:hypothetical protein
MTIYLFDTKIARLFIPLILVYSGILEIRRAVRILYFNEITFNFAIQARLKLIEVVLGKRKKDKYKSRLLKNRNWTLWAYMGILYGIIALVGGAFLILVIFTSG